MPAAIISIAHLDRDEYERFVDALLAAETIELRDFEREDPRFFEGCLPLEALARRGRETLAFGPMRPVGLRDPRTGRRPYAVVQLRRDNLAGDLYNLVGFQTNLRWPEQRRVLRLIPGLEHAEFLRLGMMHRNTFLNSPRLLLPTMAFYERANLFFAGQITGVEGYVGNIATGPGGGAEFGARVAQRESLDPAAGEHAGRALPLCHACRTGTFPADEGEFRHLAPVTTARPQQTRTLFGLCPPRPGRHECFAHHAR